LNLATVHATCARVYDQGEKKKKKKKKKNRHRPVHPLVLLARPDKQFWLGTSISICHQHLKFLSERISEL